jgi:DNA-binding response OmpR family regulator
MTNYVLVVDDEYTTQILIQKLLKSEGYIPVVCSDGEAALEILKLLEFHLVILDINLPGINGWEIFNFIDRKIHRTSVLVLTGTENEQSKEFENKYQDNEYFSLIYKPIQRDNFLDKVKFLTKSSQKKTIFTCE